MSIVVNRNELADIKRIRMESLANIVKTEFGFVPAFIDSFEFRLFDDKGVRGIVIKYPNEIYVRQPHSIETANKLALEYERRNLGEFYIVRDWD